VRPEALAGLCLFYPAMMGIITGQDIFAVTLIATTGLVALANGQDRLAGILLGLTTYKYNLLLFVPMLLILRRRWTALAAWAATAGAMTTASILLAPPSEYVALLRNIESYTIGFAPATMIGFRGLAHMLGAPVLYPMLACATVVLGSVAMLRLPLVDAFYAGQLTALLAGYHVTWYDAALVFVRWPGLPRRATGHRERRLI
jgi:hypothetical protein